MAESFLYASLFVLIFVLTYVLIIHPKIDKVSASSLGALIAIILGLEFDVFEINEHLIKIDDLLVLGLIVGNLMMVEVASRAGIFQYISIKLLKQTEGDPQKILFWLSFLTFILSSFVNNISAIIIVSALTIIVCEELGYDPKPYILSEIIISSTGGLTTLTSAIPNIIVSSVFGIGYLEFLIVSGIVSLSMFFISYYLLTKMFRVADQGGDEKRRKEKIMQFDEWSVVPDRNVFYRVGIVFVITILSFLVSDIIGLPLAVLALAGAIFMVLVGNTDMETILEKLDWGLLVFFLGLFILIATLELTGVMEFLAALLSKYLAGNPVVSGVIILFVSALLSAILDNIVLAATFSLVLYDAAIDIGLNPKIFAWALIYGTNLGGGFTPIAAPANLIGIGVLQRATAKKVSWVEFFKTSGVLTLIRLLIAMLFVIILSLLIK